MPLQDIRPFGQISTAETLPMNDRPVRHVVRFVLDWNIFPSEPPTTNPYKLQTQRIATRIFIVLFLSAFVILLIYSSTNTTVRTITIKTPDLIRYNDLFSLYESTLSCPCSQISLEYKSFIAINYTLHPICYSDFVTNAWILHLQATPERILTDDFRAIGLFLFQALRSLCQLSEDTIEHSLNQFLAQHYTGTTLTARKTLSSEINTSIQQFISTTTNRFTSFLRMILDTSQVNAFASALFTNYIFYVDINTGYIWSQPVAFDDGCICYDNSQCTSKLVIYDDFDRSIRWHVPGFYRGCFILQALRKSHLECFYNQTCLVELDVRLESSLPFNTTALDASHLIRFSPNTLIGSIIDQLMVDRWNGSEIFPQYYNACRPSECRYTIVGRNSLIGIVTTVIGLIGGLITILKLAVPHTVNAIRLMIKGKTTSVTSTEPSLRQRLQMFLKMMIEYLIDLDWFSSGILPCDVFDQQTGRISTRCFIIALIVTFISLLIYTSAVTVRSIVRVPHPTVQQFDDFMIYHSDTLSCPCTQISSNYRAFVNMSYYLHQVCESVYITERWREFISSTTEIIAFIDFRMMGSLMFQGIQSLCELAGDNIDNNVAQFLSNTYISTSAISKRLFESQVNASIDQFISSTTRTFAWSLELIRSTTQYNPLLSALFTNFFVNRLGQTSRTYSGPFIYDNDCDCAYKRSCVSQQGAYHDRSLSNVWYTPGLYRGCFVLESLLQSHLECFYNTTCLEELHFNMHSTVSMNVTPLEASRLSHFASDTTMEIIVNSLMVDEWRHSVQHENYYNICRPAECTYTITSKRNIILIVTAVIGLFGGLVTTLKLIIPRLVQIIRWKLKPKPRNLLFVRTFKQQLLRWIQNLREYLVSWNLFPSYPPSTDRHQLRIELVSTRLFIVTFTLSMIILLIYTSALSNVQIFTHSKPDYDEYMDLFSQYSSTLQCPCSQISTSYKTFIDIDYSLHPVCNSMYVTDQWIKSITGDQQVMSADDFRITGTFQFQALKYLCELVVALITDQLDQFYSQVYISIDLAPEQFHKSRITTAIQDFISTTENSFKLSLRTIRDMTQANAIFSALLHNYVLSVSNSIYLFSLPAARQSGCSCAVRSDCAAKSGIYSSSGTEIWYVPEIYSGCFILESLRQSRFGCFYNQTCLDELQSHLVSSLSLDLVLLESSALKFFSINSTVGEIIDHLLVDDWRSTISHKTYYNSCQPMECRYELIERSSLIDVLTTLLGLIGGLVTAFRLIVPRTVIIIWKLIQRHGRPNRQNTISPSMPPFEAISHQALEDKEKKDDE